MTDEADHDACRARIARLERRLERERATRVAAEQAAECGLRRIYEREQDADLLGRIAATANGADDLKAVLGKALEEVLERTGWSFGAVYFVAEAASAPRPAYVTVAADSAIEPLCRFAEETGIGGSDGDLAAAIAQSRPVLIDRLADSEMAFARRLAARRCGMQSAVAVPLLSGPRVVAVMEFMGTAEGPPREGLVEMLVQIAAQCARVHERAEMASRLQHDALHDPLTGLPNRQLLSDRLDRAALAMSRSGAGYAILFVDLDHFKPVNDTLGHAVGDAVLLRVAELLLATVAERDLMQNATVARMGGDEFCLLIEDDAAGPVAEALAEGVLQSICAPMTVQGHTVRIGASIGLATGDTSFQNGDALLRAADAAMYGAKSDGRGQIKVYSDLFRARDRRRETLLQDMAVSVESGFAGFFVAYQPIVSLGDGGLKGFEALMRWTTPGGESIPPAEFIPLAEEAGLIGGLGDWIVETALVALTDFQRGWIGPGTLSMSINVSPKQLRPDFVHSLEAALRRHGVAAASLSLEFTENVMVGDDAPTRQTIAALRGLGVALSIDDFGTGYSTFAYLKKFAFQTLKIDRSFISAISDGEEGVEIVRAIIEIARSLGVSTIAEGAESADHIEALTRIGCDDVQGFYCSPPVDFNAAWNFVLSSQSNTAVAS